MIIYSKGKTSFPGTNESPWKSSPSTCKVTAHDNEDDDDELQHLHYTPPRPFDFEYSSQYFILYSSVRPGIIEEEMKRIPRRRICQEEEVKPNDDDIRFDYAYQLWLVAAQFSADLNWALKQTHLSLSVETHPTPSLPPPLGFLFANL